MANVVSGSSMKIDTTGDVLLGKNIIVTHMIMVSTAANAILELQDSDGTTFKDKIRLDIDAINKTEKLDLTEGPMVFPNGVRAKTVTNCQATLIFRRQGAK